MQDRTITARSASIDIGGGVSLEATHLPIVVRIMLTRPDYTDQWGIDLNVEQVEWLKERLNDAKD